MNAHVSSYRGQDRRKNTDQDEYFNSQFNAAPIYLSPGQSVWSDNASDMIVASVGAGVVVSFYDAGLKLCAVANVLITDSLLTAFPRFDSVDQELIKAAQAPLMECIGHMKRQGAAKKRIYVRLIGGGDLPGDEHDCGTKNYVFVREFVTRQGLIVLNEDLGGAYVRRLHFFPSSGRAVRKILRRNEDFEAIQKIEHTYQQAVS